MPLADLLEDALASRFDHISVARDDAVKIPLLDLCHALVKGRSVFCGLKPECALLPCRRSVGVHDADKELGEDTCRGIFAALAELLGRWKVEEKIRFDKSLAGLVVEDKLLVAVGEDILGIKLVVELCRHLVACVPVGFAEEMALVTWKLEVRLFVAEIGEGLWSYNSSFWVSLSHENVSISVS